MTTSHETADQKALRLLRNNRVREVKARVFVVAGDTGTRYVVFPDDQTFPPRCDCPSWGGCSHLAATNAVLLEENERQGALTPDRSEPHGEEIHATRCTEA